MFCFETHILYGGTQYFMLKLVVFFLLSFLFYLFIYYFSLVGDLLWKILSFIILSRFSPFFPLESPLQPHSALRRPSGDKWPSRSLSRGKIYPARRFVREKFYHRVCLLLPDAPRTRDPLRWMPNTWATTHDPRPTTHDPRPLGTLMRMVSNSYHTEMFRRGFSPCYPILLFSYYPSLSSSSHYHPSPSMSGCLSLLSCTYTHLCILPLTLPALSYILVYTHICYDFFTFHPQQQPEFFLFLHILHSHPQHPAPRRVG